jgi:hypothetical protein
VTRCEDFNAVLGGFIHDAIQGPVDNAGGAATHSNDCSLHAVAPERAKKSF